MSDQEAVATHAVVLKGLDETTMVDVIRHAEQLVAYKLQRLCELSGIQNPDVSVQWTCVAVATTGAGRELTGG